MELLSHPLRDQKIIRHHLINIADPKEGFSAAEFKKLAKKAMEDIYQNKKIPILVGGTGLYIDSLIYDYSFLPASTKNKREYYENKSLEELVKRAKNLGYNIEKIDTNNKRRVIRLLENNGMFPKAEPIRNNTIILGLDVEPELLKLKIKNRTDSMIKNGLESEVRKLVDKYGWGIEPMKGIGYREFKDYFENKIDEQELVDRINKDTFKLVKKQKTWFKRNKSIQWHYNRDEIVASTTTFMNKFN